MHVALPPDHPLAARESLRLEELAADPWLCGSSETSCRQLTLRSCEQAGFTPDVAYESNDYTVMLALVEAGMGVTLIPDLALLIPTPDVPDPRGRARGSDPPRLGRHPEAGSRSGATDAMIGVLSEVGATIIPRCDAGRWRRSAAARLTRACSTPSGRRRRRGGLQPGPWKRTPELVAQPARPLRGRATSRRTRGRRP